MHSKFDHCYGFTSRTEGCSERYSCCPWVSWPNTSTRTSRNISCIRRNGDVILLSVFFGWDESWDYLRFLQSTLNFLFRMNLNRHSLMKIFLSMSSVANILSTIITSIHFQYWSLRPDSLLIVSTVHTSLKKLIFAKIEIQGAPYSSLEAIPTHSAENSRASACLHLVFSIVNLM